MVRTELYEASQPALADSGDTNRCRLLSRSPFRAFLIWIVVIVACSQALISYDNTASFNGALFANCENAEDSAQQTTATPTIHFALHPHCPCTRISLTALTQVISTSLHPTQIVFWIYIPSGKPDAWVEGRSVQIVRAFPNSKMILDIDGRKASDLGITSSGGIVAFDCKGNLAFSGGVQSSRGMTGGSLGSQTLQEIIARREFETTLRTPVYGCSLISPSAKYGPKEKHDTEETYR